MDGRFLQRKTKHTMLNKTTVQLMALGLVSSFVAVANAQDSGALIDALIRKGVLKDQEAEEIRSQMTRDFAANSSAGKLNLSSSVKELKLSGDVRVRAQYDQQQAQIVPANPDHDTQRLRYRLRLRLNADYQVNDNFFAGLTLATESKPDSGNQTMAGSGQSVTTTSDYGKNLPGAGFQNYNVYVSRAYLGWTPMSGVTVIAGKQSNPFYTTDLVWDADINPTGFVERVDLHKFFELGSAEVSLIGGQFVLQDNAESGNWANWNTPTATKTDWKARDAFLYQTQLLATLPVAEGVKLTVAPGVMFSNGGAFDPNAAGQNPNEAAFSVAAGEKTLDNLMVILAPGDISTTIAGTKAKFLWDFAYNTDGNRAKLLTFSAGSQIPDKPTFTDKGAYLAGFQLGENKKKGDWSLSANYRSVGAIAIDPNINDSDWALSKTNMAGYKAAFVYNLGDAATIGLTYYNANNIRKGVSFSTLGDKNSVSVIQLDAIVKF